MNYIKLQKGFNKYCKMNFIPALSRLLWNDLVELFNELGWCEWIQIGNARLRENLQVSESSFVRIRNKLIEEKLIIYVKGSKNVPNRYKFNLDIDFIKKAYDDDTNEGINDSQATVETRVYATNINKLKRKPKQNKTKLPPKSTSVLSSPKRGMNEFDPLFVEFWKAYPRKENKPTAVRAFGKIKPMSREVLGKIIAGIELWKNSNRWAESKYIPHPSTFLNNKKWEDEIPKGAESYGPNERNDVARRANCTEYLDVKSTDASELSDEEIARIRAENEEFARLDAESNRF